MCVQFPYGKEDKLKGIVDVVEMKAYVWEEETLGAEYHEEPIPEGLQAAAAAAQERLVEAVADQDERLMKKYVGGSRSNRPRSRPRSGTPR